MQSQTGLDSAGRAAEVGTLLSQARLELSEANSARSAAKRQLDALREQVRSSDGNSISEQTPELDSRLNEQQRNLDSLLQKYTEQHPDVVNTRRLISQLQAQKTKEMSELRRAALQNPTAPLMSSSPVVQELNRMYSEAEVNVASLRSRVSEYESRSARVREQLKVAPQLEAELAQLNRDYSDLVQRRESALMSGELESTSNVAEFRVIDPPRVSPKPVAPNRILLLPLALLAALGIGTAMAFVMSQVRPVFFDGASLQEATELPLLGVIELVPSEELRKSEMRSLKRFLGALVGLLFIYIGGIVLLSYQSRIVG